ncbi:MAG TPA: AMP-binding protein, partial [Longimicrobiales bacterium]|nr:AMP-binding protein [Longimicrobiales bacterium]
MSKYEEGLARRAANHTPLSPLSFLRRTADVYPERPAIRYAGETRSWRETYERCVRVADALRRRGIGEGDTVAVLCPNTPAAVELAFAVPMAGAVLNMINTRLDPAAIAFMLEHGEAKMLMVDVALANVGRQAEAQ